MFSHTPEGSGFTVTIRSVGGRVQLIVDDEGAGFAEGFDPVRGASGRGSTGLGLDIVRRIASEANGSLLIRARADGGAGCRWSCLSSGPDLETVALADGAACEADPVEVTVYTDGACSGNPGPGGWGWAVDDGPYGCGSERRSTNQRMEVWAVLDALGTLLPHFDDVTVVSDSTYVVNCFRDRWWAGWIKRGWKNSQKQPVANQDLWKPLVDLYLENQARISFRWVKGHSGNKMNDRVDVLAVQAAQSQSLRRIVGLEPVVGAPVPFSVERDSAVPIGGTLFG